jgi:hypothetical protein
MNFTKIGQAVNIEKACAYDMVCRFREVARLANDALFFREMDTQAKTMEAWAVRLGINLRKLADEYYDKN